MPNQPNYFDLGNWNAQCFRCGLKRKASELVRQWQGYYVCPEHWEPRQPQDFVRGVPDNPGAPWVQPDADVYVGPPICNPPAVTCIPGWMGPGCAIPSASATVGPSATAGLVYGNPY